MAIALVGSQTKDVTFSNPKALASASQTTTNILYTVQYGAGAANTLLAGWTTVVADVTGVGGNHMLVSAFKSDGSATYTFTQNSASNVVAMQAFSGAHQSSFFEQAGSATNTPTVPTVTPTSDNSVQIIVYGTDGGDGTVLTAPSGGNGTYALVGIAEFHTNFGSIVVYSRTFASGTGGNAQTSPTTDFVWGGGGTVREISTFVIKPPAAAGGSSGTSKRLSINFGPSLGVN